MATNSYAMRLKEQAEVNAETCLISSHARALIAVLGLAFAIAAALCAFAKWETFDRIFTVLVLVALIVEGVIFGYHHWAEDAAKSREFEKLASLADQLMEGDPEVTRQDFEEESKKLGTPNQFPLFIGWAKTKVGKRYAKISQAEPIYDSTKGANEAFFEFKEVQLWRKNGGFYGEAGTGSVTYHENVINIERTNAAGRVRLKLIRYSYNSHTEDMLPADPLLERRTLLIKFEAKVPNGPHDLSAQVKLPEGALYHGQSKAYKTAHVDGSNWTPFTLTADKLPPANDLYIYFDDLVLGAAPSSLQIRNLMIQQL